MSKWRALQMRGDRLGRRAGRSSPRRASSARARQPPCQAASAEPSLKSSSRDMTTSSPRSCSRKRHQRMCVHVLKGVQWEGEGEKSEGRREKRREKRDTKREMNRLKFSLERLKLISLMLPKQLWSCCKDLARMDTVMLLSKRSNGFSCRSQADTAWLPVTGSEGPQPQIFRKETFKSYHVHQST